jgi:hypothetical protein
MLCLLQRPPLPFWHWGRACCGEAAPDLADVMIRFLLRQYRNLFIGLFLLGLALGMYMARI